MSAENLERRKFLGKASALAAGLAIAPGVLLFGFAHGRAPGEAASSKVRWGMLVDTRQCASGCDDCVTACNRENGLSGGINGQARSPHPNPLPQAGEGANDSLRDSYLKPTDSQWIRKVELTDPRGGRKSSLPVMCQHCEHPPCADVCPTGASFRRADGIVLVDKHRCIGCRYCMMACPYKARSFVHEPLSDQNPDVPRGKGTVESCTLCVHRVDRGEQPACVEACAKAGRRAILFGDLNDPESEISRRIRAVASTQIRADLMLNPGVRYEGL